MDHGAGLAPEEVADCAQGEGRGFVDRRDHVAFRQSGLRRRRSGANVKDSYSTSVDEKDAAAIPMIAHVEVRVRRERHGELTVVERHGEAPPNFAANVGTHERQRKSSSVLRRVISGEIAERQATERKCHTPEPTNGGAADAKPIDSRLSKPCRYDARMRVGEWLKEGDCAARTGIDGARRLHVVDTAGKLRLCA